MLRFLVAALALLAFAAAPASAGQWYAGDLHVHTTYSHDSWGGPGDDEPAMDPSDPESFEEAYTFGNTVADDFTLASLRGLNFLAITDHNRVDSQTDPGWNSSG